jgi:hypothetical protein
VRQPEDHRNPDRRTQKISVYRDGSTCDHTAGATVPLAERCAGIAQAQAISDVHAGTLTK